MSGWLRTAHVGEVYVDDETFAAVQAQVCAAVAAERVRLLAEIRTRAVDTDRGAAVLARDLYSSVIT